MAAQEFRSDRLVFAARQGLIARHSRGNRFGRERDKAFVIIHLWKPFNNVWDAEAS